MSFTQGRVNSTTGRTEPRPAPGVYCPVHRDPPVMYCPGCRKLWSPCCGETHEHGTEA